MRAAMGTLAALTLITAGPAMAESPSGSCHFGAGVFWTVPSQRGPVAQEDLALSLELTCEWPRFLVGVTMQYVGLNNSNMEAKLGAFRGGYFFTERPISPYAALGLGGLTQVFNTGDDQGTQYAGSGAALIPEVGVSFFRDNPHGRAVIAAQLVLPLFATEYEFYRKSAVVPMLLLGARLMLF